MRLKFTQRAVKDLSHLPKQVANRIMSKMEWFTMQKDVLSFAKPLKNAELGAYRYRIGEYRVFVDVKKDTISILLVLAVKHRRDAYKL